MTNILELIIFPGCPILFALLIAGGVVWDNLKLKRRINITPEDIMVDVIDRSKVGYNPPPSGAKPPPPLTHTPFPGTGPRHNPNNITPEELEKFKQNWITTHMGKTKVEVVEDEGILRVDMTFQPVIPLEKIPFELIVKPRKSRGRMLRFEPNQKN